MSKEVVYITGPDGRIVLKPSRQDVKDLKPGWRVSSAAEISAAKKAEADRVEAAKAAK